MNERRTTLRANLRRLWPVLHAQPAGWRQSAWTWMDRLILSHLAWRRFAEFGRAYHVWN